MRTTANNFDSDDKGSPDFIHQLIQTEFREALTSAKHEVPKETDGVVVLSFKEFVQQGDKLDYLNPDNIENFMRIETGIEIIKQVVANRVNKNVDEIDSDDILKQAPPLILSGSTTQLPIMERICKERAGQIFKLTLLDCVLDGRCNTKTQVKIVNTYCLDTSYKHLTFITSDYHVPRVVRTGYKNLPWYIAFDVIFVPHKKISYDVYQVVRGEVKRILAYAAKGDIVKHIPPRLKEHNMSDFIYITKAGDADIYASPLISQPETKPGALETPVYEDIRGKIIRHDFQGSKFNVIETKRGFMRSGDVHKNTQLDLVLSGKIELLVLTKEGEEKTIIGPNQYVVIKPHVPHLFNFLADTVMIELWDGPFATWFYKPYRDIIDEQFKKRSEELQSRT